LTRARQTLARATIARASLDRRGEFRATRVELSGSRILCSEKISRLWYFSNGQTGAVVSREIGDPGHEN
jgi:hypothetical protein